MLDAATAGTPFDEVLALALRIDPPVFFAEAEPVLIARVGAIYCRGWQPTEVVRHIRTKGSRPIQDLVRRAMVAERAHRQGTTATDPHWLRQWEAAGVTARPVRAGWAFAWAEGLPLSESVAAVLSFTRWTALAPTLEQVLPAPDGRPSRRAGATAAASDNPVLTRVRALLAKAESTEHESEAMAFTAKAQELITKHAIEEAMLDGTASTLSVPGIMRLPVDAPYSEAKALLLHTVATRTRCRALFHPDLALSTVAGFTADLEAVELLFTSLLVQAQRSLAEAAATAPAGARARSQSFRAAFLVGFAGRIGERLEEVTRLAYSGEEADSFLPVLRSQSERIDAFMAETFGETTSSAVRRHYDATGYHRGRQAGDAAALTAGRLES